MRTQSFLLLLGIASLASATSTFAQDAKAPPPTEFNGDIGFVNVAGNTSVTTLNVGERYIRRMGQWQFKQDFGVVYGETDGEESSNLWRASVRGDYTLSTQWALYGLTAFDRNRFAGITSRFAEGVGVVARLLASNINQLDVEAGFQLTQQQNLDGTNENFKSLRAASAWKHVFARNTSFFQSIEVLPNLDNSEDLRVNTETAIVAPLSSNLGLKFSYIVRFDNLPSLNAEGTAPLRSTDRIFSSGIQISF